MPRTLVVIIDDAALAAGWIGAFNGDGVGVVDGADLGILLLNA